MPPVLPESMDRVAPALTEEARRNTFVVVPAYNEGSCIGEVVRGIRQRYTNVVVVDDGSSDDTFDEAFKHATFVLRHLVNRGQGAALQTGLEYALKMGAQFIVTFDADGQHDPEEIDAMVAPIAAGECDVTLGSRFLRDADAIPTTRRVMLRGAILFTRIVNRVKLTDAHNGFRGFSRHAASQIHITLDRMAHATELIDQIQSSKLRFKEIPVRIRYTEYSLRKGQSARGAVRIVVHYILGRIFQ